MTQESVDQLLTLQAVERLGSLIQDFQQVLLRTAADLATTAGSTLITESELEQALIIVALGISRATEQEGVDDE